MWVGVRCGGVDSVKVDERAKCVGRFADAPSQQVMGLAVMLCDFRRQEESMRMLKRTTIFSRIFLHIYTHIARTHTHYITHTHIHTHVHTRAMQCQSTYSPRAHTYTCTYTTHTIHECVYQGYAASEHVHTTHTHTPHTHTHTYVTRAMQHQSTYTSRTHTHTHIHTHTCQPGLCGVRASAPAHAQLYFVVLLLGCSSWREKRVC